MGVLTRGRPPLQVEGGEMPYAQPMLVVDPDDCFFYHCLDLPGIGSREGQWDLRDRFLDYVGGVDVSGKRVLDVGTASGFLSFEAERHGAAEVVSFDLDTAARQTLLPFAGSDFVDRNEDWCDRQTRVFATWKKGYWLAHRLLHSRARVAYGDVYAPNPKLGMFDVVILGAILEHLVDPLSALAATARSSRDLVVVNTDFVESEERVAIFRGRADRPDANFIFWTYSIALYHEYMAIMGFDPIEVRKDTFAGSRPAPHQPRPLLERVALVYRRRTGLT